MRVENRSVFALRSALAVSSVAELSANLLWLSRAGRTAVKRTGEVVGSALLTHYRQTLEQISTQGLAEYWSRQFRPYLHAAALQFAPSTGSSTERFLRHR